MQKLNEVWAERRRAYSYLRPPNPTPPRLRFARRFTAAGQSSNQSRNNGAPHATIVPYSHVHRKSRNIARNTRGEKPTGGLRAGSRHTDLHRLAWASFLSFFPFFFVMRGAPISAGQAAGPRPTRPRPPDHHPPQRLVSRHVRSCHVPPPPSSPRRPIPRVPCCARAGCFHFKKLTPLNAAAHHDLLTDPQTPTAGSKHPRDRVSANRRSVKAAWGTGGETYPVHEPALDSGGSRNFLERPSSAQGRRRRGLLGRFRAAEEQNRGSFTIKTENGRSALSNFTSKVWVFFLPH